MTSTPTNSMQMEIVASFAQPGPGLASEIVATMYTTAAKAESRYAKGASAKCVAIW